MFLHSRKINTILPYILNEKNALLFFNPALPVVDGAWNEWSYSDCSKSCGGGEQIRIRSCNAPEPQNGGNDCVGIHFEINSCNTNACPQGKTTT